MSTKRANPWLALLVVCLGSFVILLDTTIVNVAIPTMIDSLHASLDQVLWVVNAYLLTFAVLLVTGGRLGDILGQRNLFVAGLAAFSVASVLCGLAQRPLPSDTAPCPGALSANTLLSTPRSQERTHQRVERHANRRGYSWV